MSQGGVPGGGVVKLLKQVPSVEAKFFDTALPGNTVSGLFTDISGGFVLAGIIQGTGNSQRVGRKIRVLGFVVRIYFAHPPGEYTFDLVRDRQCNGVAMVASEVYSGAASYLGLPNPLYEKRYQFLKRIENYNPSQAVQPTAGTNVATHIISFQKKCNFTVEYDASTGAVTDLSSDNIAMFASCQPVTATATAGYIRVLYTDA